MNSTNRIVNRMLGTLARGLSPAAFAIFAALSPLAAQAAAIDQVLVRQQWPWSTEIRVEYRISGVTTPVDVSVAAYNGETPLPSDRLADAVSGDLYGIQSSGVYAFTIDPVAAFGTEPIAMPDFRVGLSLSDSDAATTEVLYKIIDLDTFTEQDVRRADFMNGKMGDYVTDFKAISNKYWTALENVLIWTGVTNVPEYKTSKIVLRRIPAKGVTFEMGNIPNACYTARACNGYAHVTLTNNYFISVFEVTEGQYNRMRAVNGVADTYSAKGDEYPMGAATYNNLRGDTPTLSGWPEDRYCVSAASTIGLLRANMPGRLFDLPTEAQWEYAARAGTTNDLYIGYKVTGSTSFNAALSPLAWYSGNSDSALHVGGQKKPNAFGLYDMLGNEKEHCRDMVPGTGSSSSYDPQPLSGDLVEPYGMTEGTESTWNIQRGGGSGSGSTYTLVQFRGLLGKRSAAGMGFRLWLLDD